MNSWDDLHIFLAVARSGTLTAAALQLGTSPATLHRKLGALESQVGVRLFEKGPRGHRLTRAGEALLPRAQDVEEAVLAAQRTMSGHDRAASGKVRLTLTAVLLEVLAPHLETFGSLYKDVQPVLLVSDAFLDIGGRADVALRLGNQLPAGSVVRRLCEVAWCAYRARDTADREGPWVHYTGLDHVPAVQWRRRHLPADSWMQVDQVPAMHRLLATTGACGMLPCFVGDADPSLRRVGEPPEAGNTALWLVIHADLRRAARVRGLVDFLVPRLLADRALFEGRVAGPVEGR